MVDDYHRDTGEGADFYSAGKSRGCGGSGLWRDGKLVLGEPAPRTLVRALDGYTAGSELVAGDEVAFHWGWLAARLTRAQAATLEAETRRHLALANRTL